MFSENDEMSRDSHKKCPKSAEKGRKFRNWCQILFVHFMFSITSLANAVALGSDDEPRGLRRERGAEAPGAGGLRRRAGAFSLRNSSRNSRRLVLGCMDSYDSEQRRIFLQFSRSTVAPTGEKNVHTLFLRPKKKNIWRGAP